MGIVGNVTTHSLVLAKSKVLDLVACIGIANEGKQGIVTAGLGGGTGELLSGGIVVGVLVATDGEGVPHGFIVRYRGKEGYVLAEGTCDNKVLASIFGTCLTLWCTASLYVGRFLNRRECFAHIGNFLLLVPHVVAIHICIGDVQGCGIGGLCIANDAHVLAVGYLGYAQRNVHHGVAAGGLLVEEAYATVVLQGEGAVGRTRLCGAHHHALLPAVGKGCHVVLACLLVTGGTGDVLVVETYVAAHIAGIFIQAKGQRLERYVAEVAIHILHLIGGNLTIGTVPVAGSRDVAVGAGAP